MLSYQVADFLAYDQAIWLSLLRDYQLQWWPLSVVWPVCLVAVILLSATRSWPVFLLLSVNWAWVGWAFHWRPHLSLNWAAGYWGNTFFAQAFLLFAAAMISYCYHADRKSVFSPGRWYWLVLACGLILPPFLCWVLDGVPPGQGESYGMTPDAVGLQTLIVLAHLRGSWSGILASGLALLPLLALGVSGVFGHALGLLAPTILALAGFGAIVGGQISRRWQSSDREQAKIPAKEN
ncbi:MAG: hypothetical protein ACRBC3_04130 [Burkholderiaceae bacterium]